MIKKVLHGPEARESLKKGIDALATAVKATLGPKGRNVIINRGIGDPIITKDGVTVARSIEMEDPIENTGTQMIKNVALKTMELAGDGTTTATVLAQAIMNAGLTLVAEGANPMELKRGIDYAVKAVIEDLKKQSVDIGTGIEKLMQVALVSTNNDKEIASMIANAMFKMGKTGIINVEDSSNEKTSVSISKGMVIDEGLTHPVFVTNAAKQRGEYDDCLILIYDKKISNWKHLVKILDYAASESLPLFIMAEEVEMSAMNILGKNIMNPEAPMKFGVIKLPYINELREAVLSDIATITGAQIIREGHTALGSVDETLLGRAKKIISDKQKTTIIGGAGDPLKITARIQELEAAVKEAHTEYLKETLKERLAKLTNGIATMYVGATTEVEMNEKKDRIDDAIHAVRAAMQEGVVPGGGLAYIRSIEVLDCLFTPYFKIWYNQILAVLLFLISWIIPVKIKLRFNEAAFTYDEAQGIDIIRNVLKEPLNQICINAGIKPTVVIKKIQEEDGDWGYNARSERFEHLFDAGIVDPTMVSRIALENAASIAGLLLTTEALVMNIK